MHSSSKNFIALKKNILQITRQKYLKKMALINNMCAWLKRYLYRFIGMNTEYMPSYLNWFVYLYRVKSAKEKWPTISRILRHLILTETTFKRKGLKYRTCHPPNCLLFDYEKIKIFAEMIEKLQVIGIWKLLTCIINF